MKQRALIGITVTEAALLSFAVWFFAYSVPAPDDTPRLEWNK